MPWAVTGKRAFQSRAIFQPRSGKVGDSDVHSRKHERFSKDVYMTLKAIAGILILSTFATVTANSASADGNGFRSGGYHAGSGSFHGGFHGRGVHRRDVFTQGIVGGYGYLDGYGSGSDLEYGDWYGISPGHDECPLFRKRVMTPDGWRVQLVPIC